MQKKGWYSENDKAAQIEDHVVCLIRKVDEEGVKLDHLSLADIVSTPEATHNRRPRKKPDVGFIPLADLKPEKADTEWTPLETDKMLDSIFEGNTPERVALSLHRTPKSVKRQWQQILYNELTCKAKDYSPTRRVTRRGKRLTKNEIKLIDAHKERSVPVADTARILQREIKEFYFGDRRENEQVQDMRRIGAGVDLVMAYRFLYYVHGVSVLSDFNYDALEKEEIEFGAGGHILKEKVGSDRKEDYPNHIRSLALYLAFKYGGKANT